MIFRKIILDAHWSLDLKDTRLKTEGSLRRDLNQAGEDRLESSKREVYFLKRTQLLYNW